MPSRGLVAAMVVLGACRPERGADSTAPAEPAVSSPRVPDQSPAADTGEGGLEEDEEDAEDVDETCVADCMLEHQMQATSPDVIEDNCRRSCAEPSRP